MALSAPYEELRTLVKSHEQQAAAQRATEKAASTVLKQSQREVAEAKAEAEALRGECQRLQALVASLREKRQKERRAAATAELEMQEHLEDAVQREKASGEQQLEQLRSSSAEEVRAAKAAAEEQWAARESAMEEAVQLRSAKHALRLREVIASEEACEEDKCRLRERLRETSLGILALGVRAVRAERQATVLDASVVTLHDEVHSLEVELAASEEDRAAAERANAEAAAAAEEEVRALREEVRSVASRQKG